MSKDSYQFKKWHWLNHNHFRLKIILMIAIYPLAIPFAISQKLDIQSKTMIEDLIESAASKSDKQLDQTSLIEQLEILAENPVPINTASHQELEKLLILNNFQINSLQQYILKNGPILSVYELQLVYGFDKQTAELLALLYKME